jgi:hypothetical protein
MVQERENRNQITINSKELIMPTTEAQKRTIRKYLSDKKKIEFWVHGEEKDRLNRFIANNNLSHKFIYEIGLKKLKYPVNEHIRDEVIENLTDVNNNVHVLKRKTEKLEKEIKTLKFKVKS